MKVTLIHYDKNALDLLLFTKSTRLRLSPATWEEIQNWPWEKKMAEFKYMQGTILSSFEFAHFMFLIEGVSRAFTHQLVRHRVGTAFAQQAQRVVVMENFNYITTGTIRDDETEELSSYYDGTMNDIQRGYLKLIKAGANPQDARGVLPTNVATNIIFGANLRTLHTMCGERLCVKAQGEFQDVMRAIRDAVIAVLPWTEPMLRVHCAATGVCCFPNYKDCKIKEGVFNPETGYRWDGDYRVKPLTKDQIHELWQNKRQEAQPKGEQ